MPNAGMGCGDLVLVVRSAIVCWLIGWQFGIVLQREARGDDEPGADEAVKRAVAYLAREVPQWSASSGCFSCHNNGDGARALYTVAESWPLDRRVLDTTTRWLARPASWKNNGGNRAYGNKQLATIQFGSALLAATSAGIIREKTPLREAADLVAESQHPDGFWNVDAGGVVGSPVTYGRCLATATARRMLAAADSRRHAERIARADSWLRAQRPYAVVDIAGLLLAAGELETAAAREQQEWCLARLAKAQGDSGGWGPFADYPSEAFDTAIALLALKPHRPRPDMDRIIQRGRKHLTATQEADGSWLETTRPTATESYAQRLSTTAWVTMALAATGPVRAVPTASGH